MTYQKKQQVPEDGTLNQDRLKQLQRHIHYEEKIQVLQTDLIDLIHFFHSKGWSPATSTNYSFRNPSPEEATYTISISGIDKGKFDATHLMVINAEGNPTTEYTHLKPSAETLLHTLLYEDPSINAVVHTHSVAGTVLSRIFESSKGISFEGYEVLKGLQGINTHQTNIFLPIFPNSQDMVILSEEIRAYQKQNAKMHGFLLAGHGLYTWGESIAAAKRQMEVFEFLLECEIQINSFRKF